MRFDPDRRLPPHLEYCCWAAPRWPAGRRSWRLRRRLGRAIDMLAALAQALGVRITGLADLVHGQPYVMTRINWAARPERPVNRYTAATHQPAHRPFDPADLDFLAAHCARIPEARAALSPDLLAAVEALAALLGEDEYAW